MPKIQRKTQKIFCNSADSDQIAVFGSMSTGTPVYSNDVEQLQSNEAYEIGWDAATLEDKAPFMEEMNGVQYGLTYQLAYNFQEGIPEYDAETTYYIGSIVKVLEDNKPVLYTSLTDENLGNSLSDGTNWERLSFGGGGLEIGDIGFTQKAIDESKGKRRKLNGQLIIQEQYIQFTNIVKASVALNPSLACTEEEWQTTVTMSANGICYKFVIDDEGGTIRLPKYPDYFIGGLSGVAPSAGNGKTLGITDGVTNFGLQLSTASTTLAIDTQSYGTSVGSDAPARGGETGITYGITTDPANSGIEAHLSNDQAELVKVTYFIQVATGSETEDNITNELELVNPYVLLEPKYFETEVYNLSWLRANGSFNGSNAVHPSVYNALLIELNADIAVGETQNNYTKRGLPVKLSTDTYTDEDFVVNTAEETFRLQLKVNLESDNGSYLYFYVGAVADNAPIVNAGRIEEKLSKIQGDILNLIPNNSNLITSYGTPDYTQGITFVLKEGVTFEAPTNGFVFSAFTTASGNRTFTVNSIQIFGDTPVYGGATALFPVSKGDIVAWVDGGVWGTQVFYPMKGAN